MFRTLQKAISSGTKSEKSDKAKAPRVDKLSKR